MQCPRCQGFMYMERVADFFITFYAWKCINCGALLDRTILSNKQRGLSSLTPLKGILAKVRG